MADTYSALTGEQGIQFPRALQAMKFIAAANMLVIDENLRNAAFAVASSRHRIPSRLIPIHLDFGVGHTLAVQQTLRANAKRAGAPGVNLNLGHRTAAYEG